MDRMTAFGRLAGIGLLLLAGCASGGRIQSPGDLAADAAVLIVSGAVRPLCSDGRPPASLGRLTAGHLFFGPFDPATGRLTGIALAPDRFAGHTLRPRPDPGFAAYALRPGSYGLILSNMVEAGADGGPPRHRIRHRTDGRRLDLKIAPGRPGDAILVQAFHALESSGARVVAATPMRVFLAPGQAVYVGHLVAGPVEDGGPCGALGHGLIGRAADHPGLADFVAGLGLSPDRVFRLP